MISRSSFTKSSCFLYSLSSSLISPISSFSSHFVEIDTFARSEQSRPRNVRTGTAKQKSLTELTVTESCQWLLGFRLRNNPIPDSLVVFCRSKHISVLHYFGRLRCPTVRHHAGALHYENSDFPGLYKTVRIDVNGRSRHIDRIEGFFRCHPPILPFFASANKPTRLLLV